MEGITEFKATLDRVIYSSDDFKICGVTPTKEYRDKVEYNQYRKVTVTGDLPDLDSNVVYTIEAEFINNPKFGKQYKVVKIYREKPTTLSDVRKFLNEIITKTQTETLLQAYPDIIDRVVQGKEVDLSKTRGIKDRTFAKIKKRIINNIGLVELVNKYSDYGLSLKMLRKLYQNYTSIEKIEAMMNNEPYECLCGISGIGFKTADENILKVKPELRKSKQRMYACIKYCLGENEKMGNTKILSEKLYDMCSELVPESMEHYSSVFEEKSDEVMFNNKYCAKVSTYNCELTVARIIMDLLQQKNKLKIDYKQFMNCGDVVLTEEQGDALKNACDSCISVLAGYAGAGKTQTTKAMIDMLERHKKKYLLLAPTGRASQVLGEYCNRDAKTIHRGLEYNPQTGWGFNRDVKLNYDVVIVDETGMVDIFLMKNLLEAIDVNRTRIVFILDPEQLPSVGAGNVAHDLVRSGIIPITTLTQIFRYGEGGLMQVATKIRNGNSYVDDTMQGVVNFGTKKDYSLLLMQQEQSLNCAVKIFDTLLKNGNKLEDIIVLTGINKGDYGTFAINNLIQQHINPASDNKNEIKKGSIIFRENDRVMQIKNNYKATNEAGDETSIFNGNIGTIIEIDASDRTILVDFEDRTILYEFEDLDQLMLGYCISIHKSQGSAFKHVILMTPKAHKHFLNKNLLYVGVTRAKERVYHITTKDVIVSSLRKQIINERETYLQDMIVNCNWYKPVVIVEKRSTNVIKNNVVQIKRFEDIFG